MTKEINDQKFFFLNPVHYDGLGLTPEFKVEGVNPFHEKPGQYSDEENRITDLKEQLTVVNGSLQEGKARLLEIPRFVTFAFHPVILISENVKTILQQFNLPRHRFDIVNLQPKKIKTSNKFYLFQLDRDTLSQDIDYKATRFFYGIKDLFEKEISDWKIIDEPIKDYASFLTRIDNLNKTIEKKPLAHVYGKPETFYLKTNYDIYSYTVHNKIVVSEFLKNELERLLPDQIEFKPVDDLNIKMDAKAYSKMSDRHFNLNVTPIKYSSSAKDSFFYSKKERLEKSKIKIPADLHKKDEFAAIEKKLKVIFPDKFKKYYGKGVTADEYTFLPITSFYKQLEYSDRQPETFGSVIFAENGSGDSLGLILEEKSDIKLHPQIYEFLHETGEVIKLSKVKP